MQKSANQLAAPSVMPGEWISSRKFSGTPK
jgi:hypothetical protein